MIVSLAVAVGALAQSVSGVGFALVCGPALVAALGPQEGVRTTLLLGILVNITVLARERAHADLGAALALLLPAAVAAPLLALAAKSAPDRLLEALAGSIALVAAAALAVGLRSEAARGRAGAVAASVLGAGMTVVAGIGGPAFALWADNAGWSVERTRSTLQITFLGLNVVTLAALGLPSDGPGLAVAAGSVVTGLAVGAVAARRVSAAAARRTTLALAALGGVAVLVRALV